MENQSVNLVMVDVNESIAYANSCDNVSLLFGPADIETTFVVSSATLPNLVCLACNVQL